MSKFAFSAIELGAYFRRDYQERPVAHFREELLLAKDIVEQGVADRLAHVQGLASPMDAKTASRFLVQFAWGSSCLEGSSYSELDTQALVQYGEINRDKPKSDAVLALNHKRCVEFIFQHPAMSAENICALHGLVTDPRGLLEDESSDHFLPDFQRGVTREYEEVNLGSSAYLPPFRPGTGFVNKAFEQIIATAAQIHPVQAALFLMTRIPYLQAFANGNKRTARLAANYCLLNAGYAPLSFADMNKAEYIRAMAVFYELGISQPIESLFIDSYVKSIVRATNIPIEMRLAGFSISDTAEELGKFVRTGLLPIVGNAAYLLQSLALAEEIPIPLYHSNPPKQL